MLGQSAGEDRLLTHVIAGGAAGALASGVTTPLDVVKTRLQTQVRSGVSEGAAITRFSSHWLRPDIGARLSCSSLRPFCAAGWEMVAEAGGRIPQMPHVSF